jgi:hypothetical protein
MEVTPVTFVDQICADQYQPVVYPWKKKTFHKISQDFPLRAVIPEKVIEANSERRDELLIDAIFGNKNKFSKEVKARSLRVIPSRSKKGLHKTDKAYTTKDKNEIKTMKKPKKTSAELDDILYRLLKPTDSKAKSMRKLQLSSPEAPKKDGNNVRLFNERDSNLRIHKVIAHADEYSKQLNRTKKLVFDIHTFMPSS